MVISLLLFHYVHFSLNLLQSPVFLIVTPSKLLCLEAVLVLPCSVIFCLPYSSIFTIFYLKEHPVLLWTIMQSAWLSQPTFKGSPTWVTRHWIWEIHVLWEEMFLQGAIISEIYSRIIEYIQEGFWKYRYFIQVPEIVLCSVHRNEQEIRLESTLLKL